MQDFYKKGDLVWSKEYGDGVVIKSTPMWNFTVSFKLGPVVEYMNNGYRLEEHMCSTDMKLVVTAHGYFEEPTSQIEKTSGANHGPKEKPEWRIKLWNQAREAIEAGFECPGYLGQPLDSMSREDLLCLAHVLHHSMRKKWVDDVTGRSMDTSKMDAAMHDRIEQTLSAFVSAKHEEKPWVEKMEEKAEDQFKKALEALGKTPMQSYASNNPSVVHIITAAEAKKNTMSIPVGELVSTIMEKIRKQSALGKSSVEVAIGGIRGDEMKEYLRNLGYELSETGGGSLVIIKW